MALVFASSAQGAAAQESISSSESAQAPAQIPKRFAKILAKGDGLTPETAYKVSSVGEEYTILGLLGLKPMSQSLVVQNKKPFDVIKVVDQKTGESRDVWFDISRFYGRMF